MINTVRKVILYGGKVIMVQCHSLKVAFLSLKLYFLVCSPSIFSLFFFSRFSSLLFLFLFLCFRSFSFSLYFVRRLETGEHMNREWSQWVGGVTRTRLRNSQVVIDMYMTYIYWYNGRPVYTLHSRSRMFLIIFRRRAQLSYAYTFQCNLY